MTISAPELLTTHHRLERFDCGTPALDAWLRKRALGNQASGASRTFVVYNHQRVIAYYALASGAIAVKQATGRLSRNMPNPIPVVLLARLAVDREYQGQGFGRALVQDAGRRLLYAADAIGIRGLLVHAIDAEAVRFYQRLGFETSPVDPMTLMISLADIRACV